MSSPHTFSSTWLTRVVSWPVFLTVYLVLLVIAVSALLEARSWSQSTLRTDAAQAAWDRWREQTVRDSQTPGEPDGPNGAEQAKPETTSDPARSAVAPVQRRPAKSPVPPTYALLHDYFWTSALGLVGLGSCAFWSIAWLLRGALLGSSAPNPRTYPTDTASSPEPEGDEEQ